MKQGGFTWLKKNSIVLLSFFYLFFMGLNNHFSLLMLLGAVIFLTILLFCLKAERNKNILLKGFGIVVFVIFFDNLLIPEIQQFIRIRYLFILCLVLAVYFRINYSSFFKYFLFLNIIYLLVSSGLSAIVKLERYKFLEKRSISQVENKINEWAKKNENILVILLDGYPSEEILANKYNIKNSIKDSFKDLMYMENNVVYISTPLSTVNQLFGVRFKDSLYSSKFGEDIPLLFHESYENSRLKMILKGYNVSWGTFLKNQSEIDRLKLFKRRIYRGLFMEILKRFLNDRSLLSNSIDSNFHSYNEREIEKLKKYSWETPQNAFYFLHILTFHNNISIPDEVKYGDQLLKLALNGLPYSTKVLIFSDHGLRFGNEFSETEKRSGIFYFSK